MDRKIVDALISSNKKVITPPKKVDYADPKSTLILRNDFTCQSDDGKEFEIFMRHNLQLPFIFSIGLMYKSSEGTFILCRYNGKHFHKNKIGDTRSFDNFHIHKLYDSQFQNNTWSKLDADITDKYITYEVALYYFLNDCHIDKWERYFPNLEMKIKQVKLGGV